MSLVLLIIVPWLSGQGYTRTEPETQWFLKSSGSPSQLFRDGVFQSSESGSYDMGMTKAWEIHNQGVKVGVLSDWHGSRVADCVKMTSPSSEVYESKLPRWYADNVADAIVDCVCRGCKIVVVPGGLINGPSMALDQVLLESSQTVIVWAAPDTSNASMDTAFAEYPYNANLPNVIYVNGYNRAGQHYQSALGTNCVAAPNRIIVCGYPPSYSDGCSYGAGLVGGIAALMRHKYPSLTAAQCVSVLKRTATQSGQIKPVNAVKALQLK